MAVNPNVSILVPARNAEKWIGRCLESARAQTHPCEVIVWDDGSSDNTVAAARGVNGLRVLCGPQKGGNFARNQLVEAASGEWLQFLDADDYLEPNKVQCQLVEGGYGDGCDVLFSPVWEETWSNEQATSRVRSTIESADDLFTQWIKWQLPQTGGTLWRKEALRNIGGWNEAMTCCQEHELYLRALQSGLRWKFCPSPGAVYRLWSEETVCRRDPVRVVRTRSALIDSMIAWLRAEKRLTEKHSAAAGQAFFEMARTWARYDLPGATSYVAGKHEAPLRIAGPAAPLSYRAAHAVLGFRKAELLARRLRR